MGDLPSTAGPFTCFNAGYIARLAGDSINTCAFRDDGTLLNERDKAEWRRGWEQGEQTVFEGRLTQLASAFPQE